MDKVFVLYILFPIWLIILFQPSLNELEESRNTVAQVAIQRATEKAAVEGEYTEEIISEMTAILKSIGYDESDIEYDLSTGPIYRGDYIRGSVKVPNQFSFILLDNLFTGGNPEEQYHLNSSSRMSEFIN